MNNLSLHHNELISIDKNSIDYVKFFIFNQIFILKTAKDINIVF